MKLRTTGRRDVLGVHNDTTEASLSAKDCQAVAATNNDASKGKEIESRVTRNVNLSIKYNRCGNE